MRGRVANWRTALTRWAEEQPGQPFEWGRTDCVSMARTALSLCFGRDPIGHIPTYANAREAKRLHETWGGFLHQLDLLGAMQKGLNYAQCGDVIAFPEPEEKVGGMAIGVWLDSTCLLSAREGIFLARRPDLPPSTKVYSLWMIPEEAPRG
jgi:hypothetical protein